MYRRSPTGSGFMVADAEPRLAPYGGLAGRALSREEVLAGDLAAQAYAILDAVWRGDERVDELADHAA
jgi:hypothetical protein